MTLAISDLKIDVSFKPLGPIQHVGRHVFWMDAEMSVGGSLLPGPRRVVLYNRPITDRRIARRISRRTGWTFRKHNREFKFRDGTGA